MWFTSRRVRRWDLDAVGCCQDASDVGSQGEKNCRKLLGPGLIRDRKSAHPSPTDPASSGSALSIPSRMRRIAQEEGIKTLFRGGMARTTWISLGGAIFLGAYETVMKVIRKDESDQA